jgi:hypothetical protein
MGLTHKKGDAAPYKALDKFYDLVTCEFCPSILASLWWLQSSEIFACSVILNPHTIAAIISMHDHAPMLVPLIHARSIIPK